ncbi:MAG: signal peptidase I [Anaerolineae bacterium]|nr:signal peptidase I [Anaerolineae bacterium]
MSFSLNNPQKPNPSSESDFDNADFLDRQANPDPADDYPFGPEETPLPAFDPTKTENEAPLKALVNTLPELAAILNNERLALPPPPKHIYQISPAEPDWSDYSLPPLQDEAPEPESPSGWQTAWAVLREVGETIILTLIIFFLIQTVIRNFRVVGTSMVDNLHDGQYLIIDKLTYSKLLRETLGWSGPRHGDVVVFEPPSHPGEDYVKRIVGLPGETIEITGGKIYINGQELPEPFQPKTPAYQLAPQVVPEGHVYVLGDNRNNSNDSHNWGPLPIENIVGRAWISYWPPHEWGVIPYDAPTEQATLKHFFGKLIPDANAGSE